MDKKQKNTNTEKLHMRENNASPYRRTDKELSNGERHGDTVKTGPGYGMRQVKKSTKKRRTTIIKLFPNITETDKHRKIERARKNERLQRQRFIAVFGLILALIFAVVLMFMTPLFNIKEIRLDGNDTVSKEIITAKVGDLIGENLFGTSEADIETRMLQIPQISSIKVKKALFPARIEIKIEESRPVAYIRSGKTTLVIDSTLRIIDDASVFNYELLPNISGVSVSNYKLNEQLDLKSEEKKEILSEMLKTFESTGLVNSINNINIEDIASITFRYENRIDVLCGSKLQIDRKVRMFAECIRTSTFDENSIGTIDLSVPGTATYDP